MQDPQKDFHKVFSFLILCSFVKKSNLLASEFITKKCFNNIVDVNTALELIKEPADRRNYLKEIELKTVQLLSDEKNKKIKNVIFCLTNLSSTYNDFYKDFDIKEYTEIYDIIYSGSNKKTSKVVDFETIDSILDIDVFTDIIELEIPDFYKIFLKDIIEAFGFKFWRYKKIIKAISDYFLIQFIKIKQEKINKQKANEFLLPNFNNVFFTHYQCESFDLCTKVVSLSVYAKGKIMEFSSSDEAKNIKDYFKKIDELSKENLILVHWNQERSYYSEGHLKDRYNELTNNIISISYGRVINLSQRLVSKYGQNYIEYPRLANLARLNEFMDISDIDKGDRISGTNRLLLLTKIYSNELNGSLKTRIKVPQLEEQVYKKPKWFPIGLGFATGEIQAKHKKGVSASKIAIEYVDRNHTNMVSSTLSNSIIDAKNIYSDYNKLKEIYEYCVQNKIKICEGFMDAFYLEVSKKELK